MAGSKFTAQVATQIAEARDLMEAVYRGSVQATIRYAQTPIAQGGNMPVKTGFLRTSGQAALGESLPALRENPDPRGSFAYDEGAVSLVIANADLNQKITFGYAANYAAYAEYKHRFTALAAQRWQQTVAQQAAEAEARTRG